MPFPFQFGIEFMTATNTTGMVIVVVFGQIGIFGLGITVRLIHPIGIIVTHITRHLIDLLLVFGKGET